MQPIIRLIEPPLLEEQGFQVADFSFLREPTFQQKVRETYKEFTPARNAANANTRGLRWGVYAQSDFTWLDRDTYSLTEEENPQERGRVRQMDLIPIKFLDSPECQDLFREVFDLFKFPESSYQRAYEVQLTAMRYAPEHDRSAESPPPYRHRDRIDGAVVVLRREGVIGGINRVFSNDGRALYEFEMTDGNAFLIRDKAVLHYVSDVQLAVGAQPGHRDILIVRFEPLGR